MQNITMAPFSYISRAGRNKGLFPSVLMMMWNLGMPKTLPVWFFFITVGDEEIWKSFLLDPWVSVGSNDLNWGNKDITSLLRAVTQAVTFQLKAWFYPMPIKIQSMLETWPFLVICIFNFLSLGMRDRKLKGKSNSKSSCSNKFVSILSQSCKENKCSAH